MHEPLCSLPPPPGSRDAQFERTKALRQCFGPSQVRPCPTLHLIVEPGLICDRYLETHPGVAWVSYLGLESHSSHGLAKKLMKPDAYGGVLSFGVKGDVKQASQVVDSLKLASHLANVGERRAYVTLASFCDSHLRLPIHKVMPRPWSYILRRLRTSSSVKRSNSPPASHLILFAYVTCSRNDD